MANTAQALAEKALALLNAGQFPKALKAAKLAHKKFPKEAYFANLAGMALANSDKAREAVVYFHKAYRTDPKNEDIQNNLVQAMVVSGQYDKAQNLISKLLPHRKDSSDLMYQQALLCMQNGEPETALQSTDATIAAYPDYAKAYNLRGMLLSDQGRDFEAIESYRKSIELAPDRPDTLSNISLPLSRVSQGDEALAMLERAIAIAPSHLNARHRYAIQLNEAGRVDEAKQAYQAILEIAADHAEALLDLSRMQTITENAALLPKIKSALSKAPKSGPNRGHLNFALANIYWQMTEYESAGKALQIANAHEAKTRPFDAIREQQHKETTLKLFPSTFQSSATARVSDEPTPIFVIGLPRSGTTLVEQMLCANEDVVGFGELASAGRLAMAALEGEVVFDAAKFAAQYREQLPNTSHECAMFVDKMPANYRYIGFLAEAFPKARFVCLARDPRDVALSMWRSYFPSRGMDFTFDLQSIALIINNFSDYMDHWSGLYSDRIFQIRYEDIVTDIDGASRSLAQFCRLEWDQAMAHPEQNTSAVRTASVSQVRQTVHTKSVGGWKRLQGELQPFIQALDKDLWPDLD